MRRSFWVVATSFRGGEICFVVVEVVASSFEGDCKANGYLGGYEAVVAGFVGGSGVIVFFVIGMGFYGCLLGFEKSLRSIQSLPMIGSDIFDVRISRSAKPDFALGLGLSAVAMYLVSMTKGKMRWIFF